MELPKTLEEIIAIESNIIKNRQDCNFIGSMQYFFRWLKCHNIYNAYTKECVKYFFSYDYYRWKELERESTIMAYLKDRYNCTSKRIIDETLLWSKTSQGHEFWEFYNKLYVMHISKIQGIETNSICSYVKNIHLSIYYDN